MVRWFVGWLVGWLVVLEYDFTECPVINFWISCDVIRRKKQKKQKKEKNKTKQVVQDYLGLKKRGEVESETY